MWIRGSDNMTGIASGQTNVHEYTDVSFPPNAPVSGRTNFRPAVGHCDVAVSDPAGHLVAGGKHHTLRSRSHA